MDAMTVGVDLAKTVFELAIAEGPSRRLTRRRLSRRQFERFLATQGPAHIVMEACGTAHHWARVAQGYGHRVTLLPAHHVRPYVVGRHKTDQTDAAALLEAVRNPRIHAVAPKTVAQQELLAIHRIRTQWMTTRTARLNALRGLLLELGLPLPPGARTGCRMAATALADMTTPIPCALRETLTEVLAEIRAIEARVAQLEHTLARLAQTDVITQRLRRIPGVGLLTATALTASVGHIHAFASGRRFASWLGLTPRERSSGRRRRLGRISKAGDRYLRCLLTHGARSALLAARLAARRQRPLTRLQAWAIAVAHRCGHNKAAVAMANKLARIVWVVWARDVEFSTRPPVPAAA